MKEAVIDIGCGRNPYFIRYQVPCPADEYTAVDTCQVCLDDSRDKVIRSQWLPFFAPTLRKFVAANATSLPFDDHSFDTAVLSNVLSAPIYRKHDDNAPDHLARGFDAEDPIYTERKKIIAETLRVLRPHGKLLIYTDLIIYGPYAYEAIIRELKENSALSFQTLTDEQSRIDGLNQRKIRSGKYCHCFMSEVLPESSVYEIRKRDALVSEQ